MAHKKGSSGIDRVSTHIAGTAGKGPFKFSELGGTKRLSSKPMPLSQGDKGRDVRAGHATMTTNMSGKHALTGKSNQATNMGPDTGGHRIGKGYATFGRSEYRLAGPCEPNKKNARQPSGHKKNAGPN